MALDNESFELLLSTVQRFVRERLIPAENHLEEHDEVPPELVEAMKEMGLFGLTVPEEFGGIGLSASQEVQVNFELGRTAPAFRSVFGTNIGIGSQGLLMDGTPEQKADYLPRVASGELVMSFALTEPDAGSDAAALKTRADADGDHYLLNGAKRFITNAPRAGAFTLMARTGGPGAAGISAFVVPAGRPGIKLGKKDKKMGQRGTMTCDVILENVRVPASHIIGGVPGQGFKTAMKVLDRGRLNIAAVACGIAQRVLDESARYARERKQFGKRLGEFQLVQAMLADSQAELLAGWALVREVAEHWTFERVGKGRVPLLNFSGGTEMGGILTGTVIHPLKPCAFSGSVPGTGADVVDANDGSAVGVGVTGELVMRTPSIGLTRGLWHDRERYLQSYWSRLPDLWVHGDFASRDGDGMWYVHGRSDDTLKIAGKRTGPSEVEALLMATGLLEDAVTIGVPDPIKGTAVVCLCVARPDTDRESAVKVLSAAVTAGLGGAFKPADVVFVPDLPRTRNMKLMRRVVRSAWLGEDAGDLSTLVNPEAVQAIRDARR